MRLLASARSSRCPGEGGTAIHRHARFSGVSFHRKFAADLTNVPSQDTERLCVYLMDQALQQMHTEGRAQTVLTIFDLRGFT